LSGEVEVRHSDDEEGWQVAKLDMVLYVDDHIKTGERYSAILSFMDITTFVIKPETEIIIPTAYEKENVIKLITGNLRANVKRMFRDKCLKLKWVKQFVVLKGQPL